jgi:hypothetical protein
MSLLITHTSDDYYNPQFHFCEPTAGPKKQPESLGSILFGDRIFNSPYNVRLNITRSVLALTHQPLTSD